MLRFWELAPSPNNTKVRMALRFKGVDFEAVPVDPMNRAPVLEVSGQELTPVIADRGVVINDSEAILQYLDANYPDTPRLFPRERAGRRECDAWKRLLDERVAAAWLPIFFHGLGVAEDPGETARTTFRDALGWLEQELGDRDSYRGSEMPVCDLRVAEWATYAFPGDGLLARVPLFGRLRDLFGADAADYPRLTRFLEPWNRRLA